MPGRSFKRGCALVAFVLASAGFVAFAIAWLRAARHVRELESALARDIASERERAARARFPVPRGEPLDENAALRYRKLFVPREDDWSALEDADAIPPWRALTEGEAKLLEAHRQEVRELREAVRCTRCDWGYSYSGLPELDFVAARRLLDLLILEGDERAFAGDLRGACERYLDAARVGCDEAANGPSISYMIGSRGVFFGLTRTAALVASNLPGDPGLDVLAKELSALEAALPSLSRAYECERLFVLMDLRSKADAGQLRDEWKKESRTWADRLRLRLPTELLLADTFERVDWVFHDAAVAASGRNSRRGLDELRARVDGIPNPLVSSLAHIFGVSSLFAPHPCAGAAYALARTVIRLEQEKRSGRYPEPDKAERWLDPYADGALLRYELTGGGKGYRLWSVGRNGRDDGGVRDSEDKDDIVIERTSGPGSDK